ncbi:MAG: hypothetical protein GY870_11045 [archaeon]|nr:hypothetical protein [archaeon]
MAKQNCWEYTNCGRELGGSKVHELGICPSSITKKFLRGMGNGGKFGGRICWAVSGTLCKGVIQGDIEDKRDSCIACDFYKLVREEEGEKFKLYL